MLDPKRLYRRSPRKAPSDPYRKFDPTKPVGGPKHTGLPRRPASSSFFVRGANKLISEALITVQDSDLCLREAVDIQQPIGVGWDYRDGHTDYASANSTGWLIARFAAAPIPWGRIGFDRRSLGRPSH